MSEESAMRALESLDIREAVSPTRDLSTNALSVDDTIDLAALGLPTSDEGFLVYAQEILDAYRKERQRDLDSLANFKAQQRANAAPVEAVFGKDNETAAARDAALESDFAPLFQKLREDVEKDLRETYSLYLQRQAKPRKTFVGQRTRVTKFAKNQMNQWIVQHRDQPYPPDDEVHTFAVAFNMSETAVRRWFTNNRARPNKALRILLDTVADVDGAADGAAPPKPEGVPPPSS